MSQQPIAGWYDDPLGEPAERYWDGQRWTERTRPWAAPTPSTPAAAPANAGAVPAGPADGASPSRSSRGPIVALLSLVVVAVFAVAASAMLGGSTGGAASASEAAETFAEAVVTDDWGAALRMLAPDEAAWLVGSFDGWGAQLRRTLDREGLPRSVSDQFGIDVSFGPARSLAEDVEFVPIYGVEVTAREGHLADGMREEVGPRQSIDLRDEAVGVVVVERDGRWYLSPIGTALEALAFDSGGPGAGPTRARSGAGTADAAVEAAFDAATWSFTDLVALIDPAEVQILDNYTDLLGWVGPDGYDGGTLRIESMTAEGPTTFRIERLYFSDHWSETTTNLTDWCVDQDRDVICLEDEIDGLRHDMERYDDPYLAVPLTIAEALSRPQALPVRVETVQRDGRWYISLQGTARATLAPLLDRIDSATLVDAFVREIADVGELLGPAGGRGF